jgi:hypothetical protein
VRMTHVCTAIPRWNEKFFFQLQNLTKATRKGCSQGMCILRQEEQRR